MGGYVNNAGIFLVDTIIGLYILMIVLRFLLQWVRADFYNPLSQFIVTLTNPPLKFLRSFIPGLWGIDLAAILLALVLTMVKFWLIYFMLGQSAQAIGILVLSIGDLFKLVVYIFIFTIFIRAILSWFVPQQGYNPFIGLLQSLSEPLLAPARRIIPPISQLDLSPLFVVIVLYLILILLVQPIMDFGAVLARG